MSNTDIYPPQVFSTSGPYTVRTNSRTYPTGPWGTESVSTTTNQDTVGARSRLSQATSGFVDKSNFGALPDNAFTFTQSLSRNFNGVYRFQDKGFGGYFASRRDAEGTFPAAFCTVPSTYSFPPGRTSNLLNEVKQKVLQKVKDQDVNVAVMWAERGETIGMLTSAVKRLGKAYNLARRGNFAASAQALLGDNPRRSPRHTLANNWLELQYGWLPLMSDIYGLCETMQKQGRHGEYVVVRSRKKIQEDSWEIVQNGDFTDSIHRVSTFEASCRVKMKSNSTFLQTASELGLTNPLFVAWEKVPFSFVVDWAIPIGSFLSQFDAGLGWTLSSGSITSWLKQEATTVRSVESVPSNYDYFVCDGLCFYESISVIRVPIVDWVDMISIPYVKDPASLVHLANALALLTQKR